MACNLFISNHKQKSNPQQANTHTTTLLQTI